MTTTYAGWWQVPDHLMPATALGELEYPRTADGQAPVAWVDTRDWSDRKTSIPLYDARACPPTKATGAQLASAADGSKLGRRRVCSDCGARCQRPLPSLPEVPGSGPLCPACRHIALLRRKQAEVATRVADNMQHILGITEQTKFSWAVNAPNSRLGRGELAGTYGGVGANASVGIGGGGNFLVGGPANSYALQPLSVQGQTGLNVAAGVAGLELQPVRFGGGRRHYHRRHHRG